ncbi:MazG nucleotide pyrophosphohydrolase domain-containing protein [Rhizobium sp. FKL33]|uniref:MazG nucleotide pyrophosphohydrolase domain-containing protein n=1 Tax=Rhizobium sp. FKL33 TaxID=2562307 RepID=UPI0010C1036A|nr:MazG nucleotide pyrophosphohydrolase domain-containing protein [Rhizobium sp. FKL33]
MLKELTQRFETASSIHVESHGIERDADWFLLKLIEEVGELVQVANKVSGRGRKKGINIDELHMQLADETADILGHLLLFAHHNSIDLEAAILRKWRFSP